MVVDRLSYGNTEADRQENENSAKLRATLANDPRYRSTRAVHTHGGGRRWHAADAAARSSSSFADPAKNGPIFACMIEGMTPSSFAMKAHAAAGQAQRVEGTAHLPEITAKTLIVVGKEDWLCPVMNAEHLHAHVRRSELVHIEGSGHFPWIEQPAVFFHSVVMFLTT